MGSSSYITNLDGEITQHMEYLPFGETLVEEHLNSNNSPYKFNAKEFDAETGNYYYGARYYDPKWSVWLSVDPMSDKYPSFSPYAYTLQNPVKYIDPTGMTAEEWDDRYKLLDNGKIEYFDGKGGDNVDYLMDKEGNEISLFDTSILPQLESQTMQEPANSDKKRTLTGHYAISKNHSETKELFEWIANRDSNEWGYIKGKSEDETYSFIGTLHQNDQAPSPRRSKGFGDYETLVDIHSHHGTALYDFQPSSNDRSGAQSERQRSPNAKFFIYSPLITRDRYNNAVDGKILPGTTNTPYPKINYDPPKYIPF